MTGLIESLNISTLPYANALIALVAFVLIAKAVDLLVDKVIRRFTKFTKTDIDDRIIDIIHRPIYLTIILAGLAATVGYLGQPERFVFYSDNILYSAIAVLWAVTIIKLSNAIIEDAIHKVSDVTGLSKDISPLIKNVSKIVIIVAAGMVMLSIWKINITPLMASAGILGAGVAFAAKDTIANFFGGISVFVDKPFKLGDYIVLDKGERGEVVAIGVRSTRIKSRDDALITIPNSLVASSKIINESAPVPNCRARIPVSVAYGSDIDLVERTLLEIASGSENIIAEPAPRVRFREFAESGLNYELLCWIKEPALRGLAVHELNRTIYKRFSELGIKIPFPQKDVHLYRQ